MSVIESNETTSPETKDPVVIKPTSWIDSWFDHFPFDLLPTSLLGRVGAIEPVRVEQFVDGDQLVIRAEMPGIEDDENIDVSVTGDRLTVAAKREQREESEEDGTFHSEFRYGSFSRTVKVPPGKRSKPAQVSRGVASKTCRASVPRTGPFATCERNPRETRERQWSYSNTRRSKNSAAKRRRQCSATLRTP